MKIRLNKEMFEEIDSSFASLLKNRSDKKAIGIIKGNLRRGFDKSIDVKIIENKTNNFFIMSIYPDISTIDQIVEAIVDQKSDDIIKKIWNGAEKWTIEIDSKILNRSVIDITSKELTALLLHELGHVTYSNSIPQRISKVMRLEYARANIKIKSMLGDKLFMQLLRLPIINACLYDHYKTKNNIKKELKADVFVVKMGYGEELNTVLLKLITHLNNDKINSIDKSPQNVYNDMKRITLFSLKTADQLSQRQSNIVKANLKKLLFTSPSDFVQKSIGELEDTFVKSSINESVKEDAIGRIADRLILDGYTKEFFDIKTRRLKRLEWSDIDYIAIELDNIKSNDDKMVLVSYIRSKLDKCDYYLAILDSPDDSNKYQVPNNRQELEKMLERLNKLYTYAIEYRIYKAPISRNFTVNYPEGYEG